MITYRDIKAVSVAEARLLIPKIKPDESFHWYDNRGIWKYEYGRSTLVYKGNHVGWKGTVRRFLS